jgi:myo-inositol-1(or 4)-monophosphatase
VSGASSSGVSLPVATTGEDALDLATRLAREAGALVREAASRPRPYERKGRNNFVTETDHASEALILDGLAEAFPGHAMLSEESHPDTPWASGELWVIDPLDGTRNFTAGVPLHCVTLAYVRDGVPLLGVTYDPSRDWCLAGGPGLGLRANEQPVRCGEATDLASSIVTIDLGYDDARAAGTLDLMRALWPGVQGYRVIGSAALGLAWAAAGLCDLMVHAWLWPWDIAAALALIPAGGGVILDERGAPATLASRSLVAGAPGPVRELLARDSAAHWPAAHEPGAH